jgi:hypothetical protein
LQLHGPFWITDARTETLGENITLGNSREPPAANLQSYGATKRLPSRRPPPKLLNS